MKLTQTTKKWSNWWERHQIDWRKEYVSSWAHPHRTLISRVLASFPWLSLLEIGVGGGANLVNIVKTLKVQRQLGGIDINPDAIKTTSEVLKDAFLRVGSIEDLPVSDNMTDVLLTDMTLIYISPSEIDQAISELKRVSRRHIVLCELHSASFWRRLSIRLTEGLYLHDYKKLLEKHGFYDVEFIKVKKEHWPESDLQQDYAFIIKATVPRRK